MSKSSKRISYIDIARGLSIFLLVLGHTLGYSENTKLIYKMIYSFVVPLFFFVSGYVESMKKPFGEFVKNKFIRIMVPYFIWGILFLIPYAIFNKQVTSSLDITAENGIGTLIRNLFYGVGKDGALKQNSSLWFLPALFVMEVLYSLIIPIIGRKGKHAEVVTVLLLFVIGYYANEILRKTGCVLPWGGNTVLVAGSFFYVGYLMRKHDVIHSIVVSKRHWIYFAILLVVWAFCAYTNDLLAFMSYSYGNLLKGYISSICMSVLIVCLSYRIEKNKWIEYVGKNTLSVMLFHKLAVLIFQTKAGVITEQLKKGPTMVAILLALVIAVIAICSSLLIATILKKLAPITIGEKR